MVVLDTSLSKVRKLLGEKISVKSLEEELFNLGMELESVEADDIKVDVTHDRPDLLSPQGLARALRYYLGKQKGLPKYRIDDSGTKFFVRSSVKHIRPHAVACIITGLKFTDDIIKEMIWVQEKLHATIGRDRKKAAIGIYPLEKIKPPITYAAEAPSKIKFVPLDSDKEMNGKEILRKHLTGRKYAHLLDGFKKYPCLRDSKGQVLSMPPIINSQLTGKITENTKSIFMEVTGTHWKTVNQVLIILATMFAEEGATIHLLRTVIEGERTVRTPELEPEVMKLSMKNAQDLMGVELSKSEMKKLLERMGHEVKSFKEGIVEVLTPSYRTDLWHEVDLIDDVARAYGFGNVGYEMPNVSTVGNLLERTRFINSLRDLMVGMGFSEAFTFALTTEKEQYEKMLVKKAKRVKVGESKTPVTMLRTWLLPELMKCLEQNLHKSYPINLFEASDIILVNRKKDIMSENETHLACISCSSETDFTRMKSVLDVVMKALETDYELEKSSHKSFIKGRVADIIIGGKKLGVIGELHPQVITNFGAALPITALELNVEGILGNER